MATHMDWSHGYARQADADFKMFQMLGGQELEAFAVMECHKLLFLQMACEKLAKLRLGTFGFSEGSVNASLSDPKKLFSTVAAAPLKLEWPET